MKRSEIIIELIKNEISVVQAMDILNLLLQDITDEKIKKWLYCEINGYNAKDKVPEYRIVKTNLKGNFIAGNYQCTGQDIPLKPQCIKDYANTKITASIYEISQFAIAEQENESHSLIIPLHAVIVQDISMINGEVISAYRELPLYSHTNILNKIKSKLLQIFIELEKKYGNLDEYYIEFANDKKGKEVVKDITNIIYTDNSVHIGDDNKIEKSNVGVANEN